MSISSAPAATASRVSCRRTSSELWPGRERGRDRGDLHAGAGHRLAGDADQRRVDADGGAAGDLGPRGAGQTALAASWRTLPGVSAPSSVVRSSIETARRMPCCLASVLIERLASVAARSSTATRSTCGRRRTVRTPSSVPPLAGGGRRLQGSQWVMIRSISSRKKPVMRAHSAASTGLPSDQVGSALPMTNRFSSLKSLARRGVVERAGARRSARR